MASHAALSAFEKISSEQRAAHSCAAMLIEAGSAELSGWRFSAPSRSLTSIEKEVVRHLATKYAHDPIVSEVRTV